MQADAIAPARAADAGGKSPIVTSRHAEDARRAFTKQGGPRPGWRRLGQLHQMRTKAVGIVAIDPGKEVGAKILENGEFIARVARLGERTRGVESWTEMHPGLETEFADVEPAGRLLNFRLPFRAVGTGEDIQGAHQGLVLTQIDEALNGHRIIQAGDSVFLEHAAVCHQELSDPQCLSRELAV